jgi:hypothetical protein
MPGISEVARLYHTAQKFISAGLDPLKNNNNV